MDLWIFLQSALSWSMDPKFGDRHIKSTLKTDSKENYEGIRQNVFVMFVLSENNAQVFMTGCLP